MSALEDGWVCLYDFALDEARVKAMQEASLEKDSKFGLHPKPLVGSDFWWAEIASGRRLTCLFEGNIAGVVWGSMADYPEFSIAGARGGDRSWHRDGDLRRYVDGLGVRLSYVDHDWKRGRFGRGRDRPDSAEALRSCCESWWNRPPAAPMRSRQDRAASGTEWRPSKALSATTYASETRSRRLLQGANWVVTTARTRRTTRTSASGT